MEPKPITIDLEATIASMVYGLQALEEQRTALDARIWALKGQIDLLTQLRTQLTPTVQPPAPLAAVTA